MHVRLFINDFLFVRFIRQKKDNTLYEGIFDLMFPDSASIPVHDLQRQRIMLERYLHFIPSSVCESD